MESALLFDGFRNLEDSMNLDSYFAGGFRNFLIVAAITAVIYFIIWFSIEKRSIPLTSAIRIVQYRFRLFPLRSGLHISPLHSWLSLIRYWLSVR